MSQISYGTITITDVTDIDNIQNYYLATSASSGVTTSTSGWTTTVQSMDSTKQYLWNYEQILGTGGVVINTTTPVIIGRYGQNGQNGQPGVSITSIDEYYKANNSSTDRPTSWNAVNVIDKPTAANKYLWNYQVIHYSNNTSEGSAAEARIIGVYGDKGDKGEDGVSPTVSKTGNTVTITDAAGNTVTVSDGTNGISYYTHIRYATSSTGANMTATPTSSTTYIGVYSGTSSTAPTTANSYTWSKYMGTDGISVTKVTPIYYLKTSSGSAPTAPSAGTAITSTSTGTGVWTTAIPTYINGGTYYTSTQTYLSGGTSPVSSTAVIDQALTTANFNAYGAYNIATGINQHFWSIESDYATGIPAGSYITDSAVDTYKSSKTGGNLLTRSDGIWIRNGVQTLASLTGTALQFYNPSDSNHPLQLSIGANGTLQSGNFVYTSGTYADSGTKIDLTNGSIYTPGFRTDGSNTYIRGEINALSGKIGNNSTNYWIIGNNYNYDQTASAALISHGTAFIQLDTSNTWRLSTDRIHTAWNGTDSSAALMFPKDGNTYWDWGIHSPHQTNNVWKDKFVYARKYTNTTDDDFTNRDNLSNDIDDDLGFWKYQFYIDKNGSIYARNFYLLNEDGTPGSNIGGQDAVYLLKAGGTITGNLEVNGTLTKSSKNVAYLTTTPTSGQILIADGTSGGIKTSGYTIAKSVPSNALFTDENVKSTEANTTKLWLVGSDTSGTRTGALKYDSGVYITTTAGTIHATTFEGNLSGTASRATADADGNTIKTTYLKLSGGNVTGAVTFGSSVSADELTAGDLVVNGAASFTNNLQANTINGVEVGSNPKFTDTVTTVTVTGSGNAVTSASASNGAVTLTKGTTFLTSYTETDPIFVASVAHGITSSDISNWNSKTSNTGTVTSVRVQASSPLQSSTSTAQDTSLNTTISFINQNVNTILAGPSSGTTAAAPTFRKLVVADIPDISGTYYLASNPSGYTTNTGTVTSVRVQASSPLTSTVNTASSTTLDTTIKFSNQNKNLVLAGPSTGNAAAPTFRSLVADDIPSISKSKISDFPTSLKNPNAIRLNLFNETATRATENQGTATSYVDYDGSTANQSFSAAGKNAITSIGISGDTLSWVRADGSSGSSTVTITASVASGATVLTDTNGNAISTTGNTTPVWFDGGIPKDVEGIAFSLLPTGTGASNVAIGNHSHGNITNGGDITTTATIASGDRLVINDESASKVTNSSITFGTSTTTFLSNKGTWETPSAAGSATNDSDGNPINTTYIKKSIGTTKGDIIYWSAASTPARLAIGSNGQVLTTNSSGIPAWVNQSSLSVGSATNDSNGNPINTTYLKLSGGTLTGRLTTTKPINQLITGAGTAASDGGTGASPNRYKPAKWTFNTGMTITNGDIITIKIPVAGHSYGVYLSIDNGTTYKPIVLNNTGRLTTQYAVNTYLTLIYEASGSAADMYALNGADARATVTGGVWRVINYYDSNSNTIPQAHCETAAGTAAKAASMTYYTATTKTWVMVNMRYANTVAGAITLNINSQGAKPIYINGSASSASNYTLPAGSHLVYYDGTNYYFRTDGKITGDITGNAATATEFSSNATVTLTGDTTGTSAGSKKSWSIATTNSYITSLGRAASADYLTPSYLSKVHFCLASSSMTTHKPPAGDGYITTYHWDNSGWAAQFYLRHNKDNPAPMVRGATSTDNTSDWGEWKYILTEVNYTDYTVKKDGTGASGNWGINVTGTASNVTGTVAIGHGGTGLTASPSMLTNLGSTTTANVLQASPRPGVTGTLGVGNGGTGQTSATNAANAFLNALGTGSSTPVDADYYISQYVNGGTTTTTYHRRPMSALWNYISGKISSSGAYVTIGTDQTITANQKTFNGAIRWGTTSKYGAAHYDSTLEAIVFSFA